MLLLIHADDFGLTEGVTRGIVRAMTEGVVTATSAMVCDPADFARVQAHCAGFAGRIGLHLQLTDGRPILPATAVPSLVDAEGNFARHRSVLAPINADELMMEWQAQLARFRTIGFEPSHMDTHHSVHTRPDVFAVYTQLAREADLPARGSESGLNDKLRNAGISTTTRYAFLNGPTASSLPALRRALTVYRRLAVSDGDSIELGCHPGVVDAELAAKSSYCEARGAELDLLCSPALRTAIEELGYELIAPAALHRADPSAGGLR